MSSKPFRSLFKEEFRWDTVYHVLLSLAVISKIVFFASAFLTMTDIDITKTNEVEKKRYRFLIYMKDRANEVTKILVYLLILIMFWPTNKNIYVDSMFRHVLFIFAIVELFEVHWWLFFESSNFFDRVRYLFGNVGSFKQQQELKRNLIKREKEEDQVR